MGLWRNCAIPMEQHSAIVSGLASAYEMSEKWYFIPLSSQENLLYKRQ
jgi:hypothetical protein